MATREKGWKFFRAKKPDELWQLDIKRPFRFMDGDTGFWYALMTTQNIFCCASSSITNQSQRRSLLEKLPKKPKNILTDNSSQFKLKWKKWCRRREIVALFAHPSILSSG